MGLMRFRVLPTERITEEMVRQAYLSGIDRVAWPVRTRAEQGELLLHRSVSDSANLHVPWSVEGHGTLMLATASLMERPEPYLLPLELARGAIVQVRNQLADWQVMGLGVPEGVRAKLHEAVGEFSRAAVEDDDESLAADLANHALRLALDAGQTLTAAYVEQALNARRRGGARLDSWLAVDLGPTPLELSTAKRVLAAFNAAVAPLSWNDTETTEGRFSWNAGDAQIAWCREHGLKVVAGPLVALDPEVLPHWLYLFEDDFDSVLDFVATFVRAAVARYRGQVDAWVCAGRVNASEVLSLSEPERLRLVARTVEIVRSLDPETPAMVAFDQPWAEYMGRRESDFPPLHFADALLRTGVDLEGLIVEINVGDAPGTTLRRPPVEFSRLLDAWSALGLPLWISLSAPSGEGDDPRARRKGTAAGGVWTSAAQRAFAARYVPLCLAKPMVRGVVWNQLRDALLHDFPHAGLLDARRQPKPAVSTLAAIRKACMK